MVSYGDDARIRRMSGAFASSNIPDEDVTTANQRASVMVEQATGRRPWSVGEPEYDMVQLATEYLASAELMTRFKDKEKQIETNYELAKMIMEKIVSMRTSESTKLEFGNVFYSDYKTRNMNPDADIFRSTKYAKTGGSTVVSEPF
jgi:hypothetical protein